MKVNLSTNILLLSAAHYCIQMEDLHDENEWATKVLPKIYPKYLTHLGVKRHIKSYNYVHAKPIILTRRVTPSHNQFLGSSISIHCLTTVYTLKRN